MSLSRFSGVVMFFKTVQQHWRQALADKSFRICFYSGLAISVVIVITQPVFYHHLEGRHGYIINDFVLRSIKPVNVSIPIFIIIWGLIFLGMIRSLGTPRIFLNYMFGFIITTFLRMICLSLVALDPPVGILELKDPFTDLFYGGVFITKDLFFSGHTATIVLLWLAFERKKDKRFAFFAAVVVPVLLLVQHVHYTIDLLAAPFFTVAGFYAGQYLLHFFGLGNRHATIKKKQTALQAAYKLQAATNAIK